jgi:hypothetical protein
MNEAAPVAAAENAPRYFSSIYFGTLARIALSERNFPEAVSNSKQAFALAAPQLKRSAIAATAAGGLAQALSGSSSGRLKCGQAVKDARELGDPLSLADALLALAQAQIEFNYAGAALKSSLEAQEISARIGTPEIESMAWLTASRASRSLGNSQKVHDYATRAETLGLRQLQLLSESPRYSNRSHTTQRTSCSEKLT